MYAQVTASQVTATSGVLPGAARRLDTREWVMGLTTAPAELQHACGWYAVVDVARPADTATTTYDRSITVQNGVPTVTWTARPKTQNEINAAAEVTNRAAIQTQAANALADNRTFLAITSPTNAQVVAQVKALTRQNNGIIRLLLNQLDATN